MSNEKIPPSDSGRKRSSGSARLTKHRRKELGEDAWLGRQLHSSYDAVLQEQVPDFLSALVDAFDSRDDAGATDADAPRGEGKGER